MKITKQQAHDAAVSLVKPMHDKLSNAELALKEAATCLYEKQLPKQVLELFKTHSGYFRKRSSVYFSITGSIYLTKQLPDGDYSFSSKEIEQITKLYNAIETARDNYNKTKKEIEVTILTLGTYKRVVDQLPEVAPFLTPPAASTALMVNVAPVKTIVKKLIKDGAKAVVHV